jgi:hypothetical protein
MNEQLLQYIWKFRLYHSTELYTTCSKKINTIYQGLHNTNQGPDFLNARIKIGESLWVGHVELHVKSSEWELHKHSGDENYNNVILHVVWLNDKELNLPFPTLEIQSYIPKVLLQNYSTWMKKSHFIACENSISLVDKLVVSKCKERMLIERLQFKSQYVASLVFDSKGDWEEVCWWVLAKCFGGKINGYDFEKIARSIPFKLLLKNKHSLKTIESLIFGQSGLLAKDWNDSYPQELKREYLFYRNKYKLKSPKVFLKFLRMRPPEFPTIKLALLSSFIFHKGRLFQFVKKLAADEMNKKDMLISASEYWHYHYCFDDKSKFQIKSLGKSSVQNILINFFSVVIYTYGYYNNDEVKMNQAVTILTKLKAEDNTVVNKFRKLNIPIENAFDSQAILQLYNSYCTQKKCLECSIGFALLNKK